jgi:hypothetical protein
MNAMNTAVFNSKTDSAAAAALPTPAQSRARNYRDRAADCQRVADRSLDLLKQQYEDLARQWLRLAEQAES